MSTSNGDNLPNGCLYIIGAFLAVLVGLFFYNQAHYRYCITVPDGRYSTSYYTDAYTRRNDCLTFCEGVSRDSTQVCGVYRVERINK